MGFEFSVTLQPEDAAIGQPVIHDADTSAYSEAWATVPEGWLMEAMERLNDTECDLMLREKLIAYAWLPNCTVHAAVNQTAADHCRRRKLNVFGRVPLSLYRKLVRRHFGRALLQRATYHLAETAPLASAHYRLSSGQCLALGAIVIGALLLVCLRSLWALSVVIQVLSGLFFLMIVTLRCLCLAPLAKRPILVATPVPEQALPVYTVLVPVFRETAVLGQLLDGLNALDYPRDKLDIKLILEETDKPMLSAVAALSLPGQFDVIVVPPGKPQTKPRALNYAMQFARGSLITIFDSEDIPDPDQLRLAVAQFEAADDDLGCLQAALQFYNHGDNWLSRQFAAEYGGLFHIILPALSAYNLPLPLGGTSNHFRASTLAAVGGWDPFNVTEDADLGMRLARYGYRCEVLHSVTEEEAARHLPNWMKQRRRWLKGLLQTWLVHVRKPLRSWHDFGTAGFLTLQAVTLGVFASALLHPFLLASTLWSLSPGRIGLVNVLLAGFSLAILLAGYGIAMATNIMGLRKAGLPTSMLVIMTLPGYWLLMTCAAWMALWDIIADPFHWHKTQHGISARKPRKCQGQSPIRLTSRL